MFIFSPEHERMVSKQRQQELIEQARIDTLLRAAIDGESKPSSGPLTALRKWGRTVPRWRRRRRLATT